MFEVKFSLFISLRNIHGVDESRAQLKKKQKTKTALLKYDLDIMQFTYLKCCIRTRV